MAKGEARQGFLAVPRDLFDSSLFRGDSALKAVFLELCFGAQFAPGESSFGRRRYALARGEVVTSSIQLASITGLGRKVIRRCINVLQQKGLIGFRQEIERAKLDAKKGQAESVYIINNYDSLFGVGEKKGPSSTQKRAKLDKSIPLYVLKQERTHTAHASVCDAPEGAGEASEHDQKCTFLEHPIVIEWNAAANQSKLEMVSQDTPARLRALQQAFRARNDLAWWRIVFAQAAKPLTINGKRWLPNFDQCLELDRAVRYYETARKLSYIKAVPNPAEVIVEVDSRGGASGHVPTKPDKPRDLLGQINKLAELRRWIASRAVDGSGNTSEIGVRPGPSYQNRSPDAEACGIPSQAGDRISSS